MIDLDHPKTSGISFKQRNYLFLNKKLPDDWCIFLGRAKGNHWNFRFRHIGLTAAKSAPFLLRTSMNAQICTLTIGGLLLHAFSAQGWKMHKDLDYYTRRLGIKEIFPNGQAFFSDSLPVLNDDEIHFVANYMYDVGKIKSRII